MGKDFFTPKWIFGGACITAAGVGATYLACQEDKKSIFSSMAIPAAALACVATLGGAAAYFCTKSTSPDESFSEDSSDSVDSRRCNTRNAKRPRKTKRVKAENDMNHMIILGALSLMLVLVVVIFYSQNSESEEDEFDLEAQR